MEGEGCRLGEVEEGGCQLGSSEARDLAKFTTVVRKDENIAIRGSHMQLQLGASDFIASDG